MAPSPRIALAAPGADGQPTRELVAFEDILERCCGTGRWQALLVGYMSMIWLVSPFFSFSMIYVGATPEFRCANGFASNATFASLSADTPQCHQSNTSMPCTRWVFDKSVYESTVVTEWNLVCGRTPLLSMLQSWLMLGGIAGSLFGGHLTDRLGRRPVYLPTMILLIICAFSAALVGDYVSFAVVRFFLGFSVCCMKICQSVLAAELSGCKHRAALTTIICLPGAFGAILVAAGSYAIRTWWLLQLAYAVPCLLLLPNFWLMPESPRWLVVKGRFEEALEVLRRGARWNRRQMPPDDEVLKLMMRAHRGLRAQEADLKKARGDSLLQSALDLVRTKRMCLYSFASFYIGFAIAGTFYGVTFNMAQLSSSPHLAGVLFGSVQILSNFVFPLLNRFGRRRSMAGFLFVPAVSMFLVFLKQNGTFWLILGLVAKLGVSSAYSAIGLYVSELMPTQQRGLAQGMLFTSERVGGAVSPFVVDLVSELHALAPSAVFGTVVLLASLATLLLPETNGRPMPETVKDVEAAARRPALTDDQRSGSYGAIPKNDGM